MTTQISFKDKEVIVFDLDGTIVNLSADWKILRDILLERFRKQFNEDCNAKRISTCISEVVQKGDEEILWEFFEIIREFELTSLKDAHPIEETVYFINNKKLFGIKEKVKFAILSLNTRNTIIKALELANIGDKIEYIIGREDVRKWKPAPDGLLKIQKYFKVKKQAMVFFGDLENDIITGKNAGIQAYYIDELVKLVNKIKKFT
jgi:phosphoglycolate phosphatase